VLSIQGYTGTEDDNYDVYSQIDLGKFVEGDVPDDFSDFNNLYN
jgi:hypothetical protein